MRGSTAGISDGLKGSSRPHNALLTVLDHFISSIVISPLVVGYWRGTWGIMDKILFPESLTHSAIASIIIGYLGSMIFTTAQNIEKNITSPHSHWLTYYIFSRFYTAIFGIICVNSWRGVWMALDIFTGNHEITVASITFASILMLALTKTLRNISASPFTIVTDRYEGYFDVPTLLKTSSDHLLLYLLDCTFSVCIVGSLVVFVWRGSWYLLDFYLHPGDPALSAWTSLVLGYVLVFIIFCLQPVIKYLAKELKGIWRLFVVDLYLIFSFCGTINVWRGIWNLLNIYFLPDLPLTSFLLTHAISFILLVLINSSNSLLVRGVYMDGQEPGEQCVDFPCYYIRLFIQSRRKRKLLEGSKQRGRRKSEADSLIQVATDPKIQVVQTVLSPTDTSHIV